MEILIDDIKNILKEIEKLEITPNLNNVPYNDTANELWHIIFGIVNEALINKSMLLIQFLFLVKEDI